VTILGVLEFRASLDSRGKWVFPAALSALIASYVLVCGATYFWSGFNSEPFASTFPWLLAALGVLGIALAFYKGIKPVVAPSSITTIDERTRLDLCNLFAFAIDHTTLLILTNFIIKAPTNAAAPLKIDGDIEAAQASVDFVRHVSTNLKSAALLQAFLNWMEPTEGEAERTIEQIPKDQRPFGVDPLILRRCIVANWRCIRAMEFLQNEKHKVEQGLISRRSELSSRLLWRMPR
jgi:hypothetical protein